MWKRSERDGAAFGFGHTARMILRRATDALALVLALVAGLLITFAPDEPGMPDGLPGLPGFPEFVPVAPLVAATLGVAAVVLVLVARLPGAARVSRPVVAALVLVGAGGLAWGTTELLRYSWRRDLRIDDVQSYVELYVPPLAGVLMYVVLGLAVVVRLARAGRGAEWAGGVVVAWGQERWRGAATAVAALFAVAAIGLAGTALVVDEIVPELAAWSWARSAVYWFAAAALALAVVRWEWAPLLAGAAAALGAAAVCLGWLPDDGVPSAGGWIVAEVVTAVVLPAAVAAGAWWTARQRARQDRILV